MGSESTWEPKPRRQYVTWKSEPDVIPNQEEYREDNQNLDAIKRLATHFALPKSELMSFDGDLLKYFLFMRSFENSIEKDTDDKNRRLQLLIQYCSGKAKKVIAMRKLRNCWLKDLEINSRGLILG